MKSIYPLRTKAIRLWHDACRLLARCAEAHVERRAEALWKLWGMMSEQAAAAPGFQVPEIYFYAKPFPEAELQTSSWSF
jgi:hypothetical protein